MMEKLKIDLDLALPEGAAACEECVARLVRAFENKGGVEKVHVEDPTGPKPRLCLHYDPNEVRLAALERLVRATGAQLRTRYVHLTIPLAGLKHARQTRLVEGVFAREPGVLHASVSFGARRAYLEIDPAVTNREVMTKVAERAGGKTWVEPPSARPAEHDHNHDEHEQDHGGIFGANSELVASLLCGALCGVGWLLGYLQLPEYVSRGIYGVAYVAGGWFTVKEVTVALRARRFEIDFLMLLAAIGAAAIGSWAEGALLLFLFTLGHALEGYAMRRARAAISKLGELVPETAVRLEEGKEVEVKASELAVRDRVIVKPNTRIPADGIVVEGTSAVNQAPITGESVPVEKRPTTDAEGWIERLDKVPAEHRVFAGTINGKSPLTVLVARASSESTLARVVKMVSEAETQKSQTQKLTDRFERVFVPVILGLVVLLLFAWVVIDEPFSATFYRAMAVLVAASPCALAIATPSAVLAGVARAANAGVLIKGGAHLETLGRIEAIAFDKTGTLTEGRPKLTDVVVAEGATEAELLAIAVAIEDRSDHPLASAIVDGGRARLTEAGGSPREATDVEAITGYGIRGSVDGVAVRIGKPALFEEGGTLADDVKASVERLKSDGRTVMVVEAGGRFLGVLGVMDTVRPDAAAVVKTLHALGVKKTIMLTGDNQRVADAVAKTVGITEARGDLLPEQKVTAIAELAKGDAPVAMVGDGVNDAPAMAHATVGIAMGAGGSDVALETADVALMAGDLRALPDAIGLGRAARRIIQQNLVASLGMVAFLVPATLFGFAGIGLAVALHEGSTVIVVLNALRLLAYRTRG
ncbi:MAG: cadmium-translocating P-type ATPase [Deltaproteobacteria bacterium]|nr:cadmium-translocating P-type ATPase [Deltaproteobacteria bacterium]